MNVIAPYIFCSVVTWVIIKMVGQGFVGCVAIDYVRQNGLGAFAQCLLKGKVQAPYWYIPFVAVLFLASPLFVRMSNAALARLTLVAGLLAVIFPARGGFEPLWPGFPLLYTHFTIYYLLGFLYFRHREAIDGFLVRNAWILFAGYLIIAVWVLHPSLFGFALNGTGLRASLQKLLMTGVMLVVLQRVKNTRIAVLDALAKYSFTIFFIHAFFMQYFIDMKSSLVGVINHGGLVVVVDVLLIVVYIFLCLGMSIVLKSAFGRYSRCFVGS